MGSLLKLCKPFFLTRLSSLPNSPATAAATTHLGTRHRRALAGPRKRRGSFCSSSPSPSRPCEYSSERGGDGADGPAPAPAAAELRLFNTMSRKKEAFRPRVEGKVGMYVCGVTAYDLSHIGHARVYVTFDVLYRYLKNLEYEVCYVRNFTDVDDKIIARANELGEDPISLSKRYCEEFRVDMMHLHCLPPSVEPRVSDHMPQIIDMIKKILDNGCAYQIDGDVYFSVDKFPEYGQLSGRKLEDNRAGERVAVDSRKKNPADFALWKSAKEGEPFWESPWGPGRPGWHIECSAMSAAYLGYSFDIHGGGMDLVFPHHENEIAQSCAACRKSNISYWIHNGFVTVDSEKMSKSLGNFFTIRQVIELYHPLALRLFLLGTHYRSPINYADVQLESASERMYYIYQLQKGQKQGREKAENQLRMKQNIHLIRGKIYLPLWISIYSNNYTLLFGLCTTVKMLLVNMQSGKITSHLMHWNALRSSRMNLWPRCLMIFTLPLFWQHFLTR
ncbi:cysteine--tRNA ligase, chloroplastic/mitochondrial isoform X2 [Syzygium oleosum]|uniref:cysteine--tRNA ligase, chloroplastic/mitochondrial isoform X2 n=1 Tax=Syzygium oleosum TaxID=219896 RepID=UPI0024BA8A5B|nr:cysteine--tRNA ligase, chloroplastic/mitochondrial isoform X2 [Syzygium oleosum]